MWAVMCDLFVLYLFALSFSLSLCVCVSLFYMYINDFFFFSMFIFFFFERRQGDEEIFLKSKAPWRERGGEIVGDVKFYIWTIYWGLFTAKNTV